MPDINIIGIGTGSASQLTKEAKDTIKRSSCLIGDKRVLKPFASLNKPILESSRVEVIKEYLKSLAENDEVSVLVSGDVGFYSLAKSLTASLEGKENTDGKNRINQICGISSLQYFCSKLKTSWDDIIVSSLHGRNDNIIGKIMNNKKVFVLTGGKNSPGEVCRFLCDYGMGELKVSVGENLSYEQEKISSASIKDFAGRDFAPLSVMAVFNDQPLRRFCNTHGLPDDMFIRGKVPMTKQEIRAVSLSKLELKASDTAYDIGAGTGSVAVEMALQLTDGFVFALEKDSEAVDLIAKNKDKFGSYNLSIIKAFAPVGLEQLPSPDKVFIGGSSGNLKEILNVVYTKNEKARVVINAITLETLNEAISYYKNIEGYEVEIVNIAVSRAQKLGDYNLMKGQNPVFVITAQKKVST